MRKLKDSPIYYQKQIQNEITSPSDMTHKKGTQKKKATKKIIFIVSINEATRRVHELYYTSGSTRDVAPKQENHE